MEEAPRVGCRVVVPLGHKKWTGVIWEVHERAPQGYAAKPVEALVDEHPVVTARQIELFDWMAAHYMCSVGEVLMRRCLPA